MTPHEQAAELSAVAEGNDLLAAAHNIFEGGKAEVTLHIDGEDRLVVIRPAKMKQLTGMVKFFRDVIGALSQSQLASLIGIISAAQAQQLEAGADPRNINLRELAQHELLKGDTFGSISIIGLLFQSLSEFLPDLVVMFTNLSKDEYEALDLDEGALLVMGIISLNYDFFSQRLLPVFLGFVRSLLQQAGASGKNPQETLHAMQQSAVDSATGNATRKTTK